MTFPRSLHKTPQCKKGQDLIEYALVAGLIALAVAIAVPDVSMSVSRVFSNVVGALNPQVGSAITGN